MSPFVGYLLTVVIFSGTSGICVEEDPTSLFDRASPVRCAGETPTIPADVLSE